MEYYQKASEALRQGEEYPLHVLKNAGLTAIGGGAGAFGAKALGKIMPAVGALINQYVPENIAMAGLNKVDPRFGKFIQGAMAEGYSFDDVRKFLGDKVEKTQEQNKPKEDKNIIEQVSPELHQYILDLIKQGRKPLEAAALATLDKSKGPNFKSAIQKLQNSHKVGWGKIVESIYGNGETAQQNPQPMQQQPQQPGQGQQALMAVLQKINQKLGQ